MCQPQETSSGKVQTSRPLTSYASSPLLSTKGPAALLSQTGLLSPAPLHRYSNCFLLAEGTSADLCISQSYPFIKAKIEGHPAQQLPKSSPQETAFLLLNVPGTLNVCSCGSLGKCGFVDYFFVGILRAGTTSQSLV